MELTAREFKAYFKKVIDMIEAEKDYLCELDRKLGDGDHGVTMSIGWQAVKAKLDNDLVDEEDCGKISIAVGKTFLNAVGSSVGPLYATGFMRGAKIIKNKVVLNGEDLAYFWVAFGNGVKERGKAKVGDKTMVDTLDPFVNVIKNKYDGTQDFLQLFHEAVTAAKEGMHATKDLASRKGRSSRLGERSIGVQDPGATSAYYILATFLEFIEDYSRKVS
ncbi:dihydroxyacetone kinase subunit L [Lentibacillus populi]|uniref:phosphoenolpyruvate--glycerone phosphotransferase n=1 Tax=Lentibacillus populi TaxID=1827502 RepID=A0A9W5TXD3_9BACI|nr:dihydroxyacetone kinase subunit DhaL [Lentibacillus populi]MBT2216333.1 dihydroxyacetone kinase subunit L [Virgibacillus dakarensis]GGB43647.1 dihydroxyacetone kinase subunit L [Lentibacillus populi]